MKCLGDGGNGVLMIGSKGKMMCGTYGINPQLLPTSRTKEIGVPQNIIAHTQRHGNGSLRAMG
jgi:hypothetical protein